MSLFSYFFLHKLPLLASLYHPTTASHQEDIYVIVMEVGAEVLGWEVGVVRVPLSHAQTALNCLELPGGHNHNVLKVKVAMMSAPPSFLASKKRPPPPNSAGSRERYISV